jgi:superfamily II DNA or RNA helicase
MPSLAPVLTPHGRLMLAPEPDAPDIADELARRLTKAFARGAGHGLFHLGAAETRMALPPLFGYWREFATRYVTSLCARPDVTDGEVPPAIAAPSSTELEELAGAVPPMTGAEYLSPLVLGALWDEMDAAFRSELQAAKSSVQSLLASKSPTWHLVGRVYFNLAENRRDPEAPFAFLATYTSRLTAHAKAHHLPLARALSEYAGAHNKPRLLSLLLPVQRAAEQCAWLKTMVQTGEIYHPLRWTPAEAFQLLTDLPRLESAGVIVRVPGAWRSHRPPRPRVQATVGGKPASGLGAEAVLDFRLEVTLDGETLSDEEIAALVSGVSGLRLIRGRWVEVDREALARMLDEFREVERTAADQGLTFVQAMRLLSGATVEASESSVDATRPEWSRVVAGPWLAQTLDSLRHPEALHAVDPGSQLQATLRPYQRSGVEWLHLIASLGFGACLADDMGLGKTMQVLSLLLVLKQSRGADRRSSLLVVPASLVANWVAEIERFAPSLTVLVAHPSAMSRDELRALDSVRVADVDLVITTYGSLRQRSALSTIPWRLAIMDEAQALKNPAAQQTRAARQVNASARIALTGTPVENRLGDLWSIFDVINPGLLGSAKDFSAFTRRLAGRSHNPYGPLRELVRPYILRRLKTDRAVIADLPDKTEMKAFCHLSRAQAALYQQAVKDLQTTLHRAEGIERRGAVLASLMRLKQICNHPSQWLGDDRWRDEDSGKLQRLREIADVIAARQEKVLIFTQFKEVTAPLAAFLERVFDRPGVVLHGGTDVKKRRALVRAFQEDERVPFFVLSLKAGGVGLNLTAASHVVHFDRWWNPAVEDQATDRAFRIGQTKNVLVHKFVCRGTVEEKIDQLIESKQQLSRDLLEGGAELRLTEMDNDALLRLVALDINTVAVD